METYATSTMGCDTQGVVLHNPRFTLDFGDYSEKYYSVETMEGEQISRLISGYIDIIIKRRNQLNMGADPVLEEHSVVEDYVQPGRANNVAVVNSSFTPKQAKQVVPASKPAPEPNRGVSMVNATPRTHSTPFGQIAVDLDLLEEQSTTKQNIRNALGVMSTCARDLYTSTHLPPIANDPIARKWRQETAEINAEAVASHISAELAATSSIIMLCNASPKDMEYASIDASIAIITSSISQTTQALRMLAGLTPSEEEANDLLDVGKSLVDATCELLSKLESTTTGQFNTEEFFNAARAVGAASATALGAIDKLDVSESNQDELLGAARDVSDAVKNLALISNEVSHQLRVPQKANEMRIDAGIAIETSAMLLVNTQLLASVISTPLCREHLIESAVIMRDAIALIGAYETNGINPELEGELQNAINETEECLAFLVEKARNIENNIDYEIEAYYDQVLGAADDLVKWISVPDQMISFAKELTVNSTRLVEVLKTKASSIDDGKEKSFLNEDAAALSDVIMKMVAAARNSASSPSGQPQLMVSVEQLKTLSATACTPYVKANTAHKLVQALKSTIAGSNHVIGAAKHAAPSNRDQKSQLQLNRAGKRVTDSFPNLIELVRETKASPKDFAARYQLLTGSKAFYEPILALVNAAKVASSTTVDTGSQIQLLNAAQQLAEEVMHLQRLCAVMEDIVDGENIESVLEPVQNVQADLVRLQEESKEYSSADVIGAESELVSQSRKLRAAIQALEHSSETGNLKELHAAYVDIIKEYRGISAPLGVVFGTSDDFSKNLLQNALDLGESISNLIGATKVNGDVQTNAQDVEKAILQLLGAMPSSKTLIHLQDVIRKCINEFPKSYSGEEDIDELRDILWACADDLGNAIQDLVISTSKKGNTAEIYKGGEMLEVAFLKMARSLEGIIAKEGTHVRPPTSVVETLGIECIEFLDLLKLVGIEGESNTTRGNIISARARGVQEIIDGLLSKMSMSVPGQTEYSEATELLNNFVTEVATVNDAVLEEGINYVDNIAQIKQSSSIINQNLNVLKAQISNKTDQLDASALADAVLNLVKSIGVTSRSGIESAKLVASMESSEHTKTKAVLDRKPFEEYVWKIRNDMKLILKTENTQKDILGCVAAIAKASTGLCALLKSKNDDTSLEIKVRKQFVSLSGKIAKSISPYVDRLKVLTLKQNAEAREGCLEGARPFEAVLLEVMEFVNSQSVAGQQPLSQTAALRQAVVVESTRKLIDQGMVILNAGKSLSANTNDANLRAQLMNEVSVVASRVNDLLVESMNAMPAQKECDDVLAKLEQTSVELEKAKNVSVKSVKVDEVTATAKKGELNDHLQVLSNLAEVISKSVRGELPVSYAFVTLDNLGF
jgi:talin